MTLWRDASLKVCDFHSSCSRHRAFGRKCRLLQWAFPQVDSVVGEHSCGREDIRQRVHHGGTYGGMYGGTYRGLMEELMEARDAVQTWPYHTVIFSQGWHPPDSAKLSVSERPMKTCMTLTLPTPRSSTR